MKQSPEIEYKTICAYQKQKIPELASDVSSVTTIRINIVYVEAVLFKENIIGSAKLFITKLFRLLWLH